MRISGIKQHDNRDCGAACVATIFRYYGINVPLVKVREKMKVDKNGSSLYAISLCAEEFNFITEVLEGTFSELEEEIDKGTIKLPIIVHCIERDLGHFVIIKKLMKNKIKVFDPAKGDITITIKEFISKWTGYLVTIKKGNKCQKCNLKKGFYLKYWNVFIYNKNILLCILMFSLALSAITILASLSYQRIIDSFILGNKIPAIQYRGASRSVYAVVEQINSVIANFHLFFLALVAIFLFQMILSIIKGVFIAKISNKIHKELIGKYLHSVIKLPVSYFKDRETGEILSRFSDIEEIKSLISEGAVTIIINIFMVMAGGAILININLTMFLLVIGILFIYVIIVLIYKGAIASIKFNIL